MSDYTLSVKITGDAKGYKAAVESADDSTKKFSDSSSGLASKLSKGLASGLKIAAAAAASVGAALGAATAASIKVGSEFEAQMSRVQAISGATGDELEALRNQAIQLGADTAFSASSAAEGMENLAAAGFTTQEIMDAMPGLLDLAAASGEDLAASSDIAAATLRGFGLAASEAGHVADVLAANANMTNSSVYETGEAMKYIAPVANAVGLSLEEVSAAIGIMANAGIQGSQAGTTLRGALTRLAKPTDAMLGVMDELGLSFYDSNGQMKSLTEMVGMLSTNMAGLTDEEKQNALVTLFGTESLSGMLALMNEGEGELTSLTEAFRTADGAAADAAATMQDNLQGAVEQMKGSLETLGILIYDSISEPLKGLAQQATDRINQLTEAFQTGGFEGLINAGSQMAANLLLGVAESLPQGISIITQTISTFAQSISANSSEFISAGAQIISSLASGIISAGGTLLTTGAHLVIEIAQGITSNADSIVSSAATVITNFVTGVAKELPNIIMTAVQLVVSLATALTDPDNLTRIINAAIQLITSLAMGLLEAIPVLLEAIPTIIANVATSIVQSLPILIPAVVQILMGVGNALITYVGMILRVIPELFAKIKTAFQEMDWAAIGKGIIDGIKNGITNMWGTLVETAKSVANSVLNAAKSVLGINSPSKVFRDEVGRYMALGIGVGFEMNVPTDQIKRALDDSTQDISSAYINVQPSVASFNPTAGTGISTGYNSTAENIWEGTTIIVDNTTNLDGTPIYRKASEYTVRRIGNQQRAVLRAKGAY